MQTKRIPTGHLKVERGGSRPVWVAKHTATVDGKPTRTTLGPAWVKDQEKPPANGEKYARGEVRWEGRSGSAPEGWLTYTMAKRALDELLHRPLEQKAKANAGTFAEACEAYLKRAERDREASTFRGYRGIVRTHLLPRIGANKKLSAITTRDVDQLREDLLDAGKAPRTVQQTQVVLHGILGLAVKNGLLEVNPARNADKVRLTASGDFNHLEPEQVEAIAREIPDETYAALVRFAAYSGLRAGELRALRWCDIDFAHAVIRVRRNSPVSAPVGMEKTPKSGKVRSVPLIDPAARVLDALSRRELHTGPDDRVFPAPLGGPFDDNKLRAAFYAGVDAVGLGELRRKHNPLTFHDLRHVFGSLAVRVAPLTDVKAWMGHADISTTMIYVHSIPQNDAAAKLSQAFAVETTAQAVAADYVAGTRQT